MHDPMQQIFDAAEAAQDALHYQAGLETALRTTLTPLLAHDPGQEVVVWSLIESLTHFRTCAMHEVQKMQNVSMEAQ